jgi:hypothetical protein
MNATKMAMLRKMFIVRPETFEAAWSLACKLRATPSTNPVI